LTKKFITGNIFLKHALKLLLGQNLQFIATTFRNTNSDRKFGRHKLYRNIFEQHQLRGSSGLKKVVMDFVDCTVTDSLSNA